MKFGPVVQMSFKDISYLELWQPFVQNDLNNLCIIGRRHYEEQSGEIILHFDQLQNPDFGVRIIMAFFYLFHIHTSCIINTLS